MMLHVDFVGTVTLVICSWTVLNLILCAIYPICVNNAVKADFTDCCRCCKVKFGHKQSGIDRDEASLSLMSYFRCLH